jgi:hypothetical protein
LKKKQKKENTWNIKKQNFKTEKKNRKQNKWEKMESQKGQKRETNGWKKQKQQKRKKKEHKRKDNVKRLETQPLYEFFKFKIHSNKQIRRT